MDRKACNRSVGWYGFRRGHRPKTRQQRRIKIPRTTSTVDEAEVARFSALATEWWDPRGKMAPLHKFNPVRIGYVRDRAAGRFGREAKRLHSLKGLRVLDIGCGGGLLSEPLARLGAEMVGVDPSDANIGTAK